MTQIAVLYHSGYGHTQRVAQYLAEGAGADLITIDADAGYATSTAHVAWTAAVASRELVVYAGQVKEAADASAELARRMTLAGNFSRLAQMREQNATGANIVAGGPSAVVGLNTTFTAWPIFSLSKSQSTMLVMMRGPSASST